MKKILINYLRSFKQYFVQMLGVLLFLVILSSVSIGMMTTSLQIQSRASKIKNNTNEWDLFFNYNAHSLTNQFVYEYFYEGNPIKKDNEIFLSTPNNQDGYGFLTPRFKEYLSSLSDENEENEKVSKEDLIAKQIKSSMLTFEQGGKVKSEIKDSNGAFLGADFFSTEFTDYLGGSNPEGVNYNHKIPFYVTKTIANNNFNKELIKMTWSLDLPIIKSRVAESSEKRVVHLKNGLSRDFNNFNGQEISQLYIQKGRNVDPNNLEDREIVLTDKFARLNNLKPGSIIELETGWENGKTQMEEWKVVGTGIRYEDLATTGYVNEVNRDMSKFGFGYVDDRMIEKIEAERWEETSLARANLSINNYINFQKSTVNLNDLFMISQVNEFGIYQADSVIINNLANFKNQPVIIGVFAQVIMNIVLGFLIISLAFIFIMFLIKKELNESVRQIGIFKAFGYRNSTFASIFAIKTTIIVGMGILLGLFLSLPLQYLGFISFEVNIMFFIHQFYFNALFLFMILIIVPILFGLIAFTSIILSMKKTALEMISDNGVEKRTNSKRILALQIIFFPFFIIKLINDKIAGYLEVRSIGFNWRLRRAFTTRSMGKFILIMFLFSFSSLILISQFQVRTFAEDLVPTRDKKFISSIDHSYNFGNYQKIDYNKDEKKLSWVNPEVYQEAPMEIDFYENRKDFKKNLDEKSSKSHEQISWLLKSINKEVIKNSEYIISDNEITGLKENDAQIIKDLFLSNIIKINPSNNYDVSLIESVSKTNPSALKNTLFLMTSKNYEDLNNNYYLSDVGKTACLIGEKEFLKEEGRWFYQQLLKSQSPESALAATRKMVESLIKNNSLDCDDNYYWNPLNFDDLKSGNDISRKNKSLDEIWSKASPFSKDIFQLAFLNDDKPSTLVLNNQLLLRSGKEYLTYNFKAAPFSQNLTTEMNLVLADTTKGDKNAYFNVIKNSQMSWSDWSNLSQLNNSDNSVNAVISKLTAKTFNLKKGDIFKVIIQTDTKLAVPLTVSAINGDDIYSHDVIVDHKTFLDVYGDEEVRGNSSQLYNNLISTTPVFNYSNKVNPNAGDVSLIARSLTNISNDNTPIFGSIFSDFIDFDQYPIGSILDKKPTLMTNPVKISESDSPYTNLFSAEKAYAKTMTSNLTTILNIVLGAIIAILSIIIMVLVLSIIDEAAKIILTLKSLGYSTAQVNWIVMGDYFIWGLILFICSYFMSILFFYVFSIFAWSSMNLLINYWINISIALITFSILTLVILCGWVSSYVKIKRKKITEITI
ncbi:ABC transporter permease [Spiroplasma alleghenense]|uniref:ABC transporter permease n=1 Tax=Spiroplasma alleghenense TaxID=216931 RepID=A0A345Z3X5_9MOLU|nr:ABC transporter permease [Spiroplasma alleghenense]AXK51304.1 ABC transporter permease [Spiroplasma alleghenense]